MSTTPPLRRQLQRRLFPLYKRLERHVHPLRYLFIEITQRCNLSCLHCGSDCGPSAAEAELTTEEWLSFFGALAARMDPSKFLLVLTGGEPFVRPEFDRIMEGLAANHLTWGMVSNGYAVTRSNMAKAMGCGLSSMTISLDGLGASHNWLRGRPDAFRRACRGIEQALAADLPFFDVVTCVHPGNLDELPAVFELLKRMGVRAWRLFAIFPKGRAKDDARLLLDAAGYRALMGFVAAARKQVEGSDFSVQFSCEGYFPAALDASIRDDPYFCRAGISIGSVLCDGSIMACPNISRSLVQGNIRRDDFATVWETEFGPFRDRGWMRTGECLDCVEWAKCQGGSMHLWDDGEQRTCLCTFKAVGGAQNDKSRALG